MSNIKHQITETTMENYVHDCRLKMAESIREIREKKGYSQEQLAKIMNVSRTTISKIESGKFNCSMDYLSKFSWFLEFEIKITDCKKYNMIK